MVEWIDQINWYQLFVNWGIIIVKVIVLFFIYLVVKAIGKKAIVKAFDRKNTNDQLSPGRRKTLQSISNNILAYSLLFIFVGILFDLFGVDIKMLIAGAGIVGLAIGFGAQGLVSDVVTGFFILLEKQIDVGDYVTVASYDGIIEDVGLRTTQLRGFDGTLYFIPNREIASVSNHSRGNMRALVDISIPYENDIDEAMKVMQDACNKLAASEVTILEGPDVVGVQAVDSAEVVIRVICKTKNMEQWSVERKLRKLLKEVLEKKEKE